MALDLLLLLQLPTSINSMQLDNRHYNIMSNG